MAEFVGAFLVSQALFLGWVSILIREDRGPVTGMRLTMPPRLGHRSHSASPVTGAHHLRDTITRLCGLGEGSDEVYALPVLYRSVAEAGGGQPTSDLAVTPGHVRDRAASTIAPRQVVPSLDHCAADEAQIHRAFVKQ
jgi:hypothetical protein